MTFVCHGVDMLVSVLLFHKGFREKELRPSLRACLPCRDSAEFSGVFRRGAKEGLEPSALLNRRTIYLGAV